MCVCVGGGGGGGGGWGLDRKRYYSVTLSHLLVFVHRTLRSSIINVKPIAIIKNHKINETMCGYLANENFKMSQMYRKQVYFVQNTV